MRRHFSTHRFGSQAERASLANNSPTNRKKQFNDVCTWNFHDFHKWLYDLTYFNDFHRIGHAINPVLIPFGDDRHIAGI